MKTKKVTSSDLREVLQTEIRKIVKEEIALALSANSSPVSEELELESSRKLQESPLIENLMADAPVAGSREPLKASYDITNPADFNDLLMTTEVPANYYEGATAQPETAKGVTNINYKPTKLQDPNEVDGENLNELENTDFGAFLNE